MFDEFFRPGETRDSWSEQANLFNEDESLQTFIDEVRS
jgi:hypothetical protein